MGRRGKKPDSSRRPARRDYGPDLDRAASNSKSLRRLLKMQKLLDSSSLPEETRQARISDALDFLHKKKLYVPSDVPETREGAMVLLDTVMTKVLLDVNPVAFYGNVMDLDGDEYVKVLTGESHELILRSKKRVMNPHLRRILDTLEEQLSLFHSHSVYKAYAVACTDVVGVQVDHGKHKGYLAAFWPPYEKCPLLLFEHFEHGNGMYAQNRAAFLRDVLNGLPFVHPHIAEKRGPAFRMRALSRSSSHWEVFIRLTRAVKDMDLYLRTAVQKKAAVWLFRNGVTNMDGALPQTSRGPGISDFIKVNRKEKETLQRISRSLAEVREFIDWVRKRHSAIRSAKELNFEILSLCTDMQMLFLQRRDEGMPVLKREANAIARQIRRKLQEMAPLCLPTGYAYSDFPKFSAKVAKVAGRLMQSISERESFYLLPEDCRLIMENFADRGLKPTLKNVETVNEMVRLLHTALFEWIWGQMQYVRMELRDSHSDVGLLLLEGAKMIGNNLMCIGMDKGVPLRDTPVFRHLESLGRSLGPQNLNEMKAVALIGADYAEITMPLGKHYAEMSADLDEKNHRYSASLFYADTAYEHAQRRKRLVELVLENLGFELLDERTANYNTPERLVIATFTTQDRQRWDRTFPEMMRLMSAVKDLDLGFRVGTEMAAEAFAAGFTDMFAGARYFERLKFVADDSVLPIYLHAIGFTPCPGDEKALTRCLVERFLGKPAKLMPHLGSLSSQQLDNLIMVVIDMELEAKDTRDKRRTGQLKRLYAKLSKLYEEREN